MSLIAGNFMKKAKYNSSYDHTSLYHQAEAFLNICISSLCTELLKYF